MKPFTGMKTCKRTNNQVIQEQIIGLRQDKLGPPETRRKSDKIFNLEA